MVVSRRSSYPAHALTGLGLNRFFLVSGEPAATADVVPVQPGCP